MKYPVIGIVVAVAWFTLWCVMLTAIADTPIAAAVVSVVVSAPVILAVLLHQWGDMTKPYVVDVTALLYGVLMVGVYVDTQHYHPDPQAGIAFIFYPVVALVIIGVEAAVFNKGKRRSTRRRR